MFVAGFIGSPAMNIFKGTIHAGTRPWFETTDGTKLPLAKAPPGSNGQSAIYGIRPEHLALGKGPSIVVTVVEPTGSETQVLGKLAGEKIIGVFRERTDAKRGEMLPVVPDPSLVHLFDAASGKRMN